MANGKFQLIDLETDFAFEFPYFPEEIGLNHAANWEPQNTTAGIRPLFHANREPYAVSVRDLILDQTERNESLKPLLDDLELFMTELADGRPPSGLLAVWGDYSLRCVLADLSIVQIFFSEEGNCIRARIGIELLRLQEDGESTTVKLGT